MVALLRQPASPKPKPYDFSGFRFLVVDDNEEVLASLEKYLWHHGAWISIASNGTDALALAELEPFDLAILDVMMPQPDGWEVFWELRQMQEKRRLPVLFLTALMTPTQTDFLNLGCSGHCQIVTKGVPMHCLLDAIYTLLHQAPR